MKTLKELIGSVILFFSGIGFLLISGILIAFLRAYIALDIIALYGIDFLSAITFVQMYGIMLVWGIIRNKFIPEEKEKKEEEEFSTTFFKGIGKLFGSAIAILLYWWFAHIIYSFL